MAASRPGTSRAGCGRRLGGPVASTDRSRSPAWGRRIWLDRGAFDASTRLEPTASSCRCAPGVAAARCDRPATLPSPLALPASDAGAAIGVPGTRARPTPDRCSPEPSLAPDVRRWQTASGRRAIRCPSPASRRRDVVTRSRRRGCAAGRLAIDDALGDVAAWRTGARRPRRRIEPGRAGRSWPWSSPATPGPFLEEALVGPGSPGLPRPHRPGRRRRFRRRPDRPRRRAALPSAFVRRLEVNAGFGGAANDALTAVEGAPFLLVCHDDVVLDPTRDPAHGRGGLPLQRGDRRPEARRARRARACSSRSGGRSTGSGVPTRASSRGSSTRSSTTACATSSTSRAPRCSCAPTCSPSSAASTRRRSRGPRTSTSAGGPGSPVPASWSCAGRACRARRGRRTTREPASARAAEHADRALARSACESCSPATRS